MKSSGGVAGLGLVNQMTGGSGGGNERGAGGSTPTFVPLAYRTPGALYEPVRGTGVTGRGRGGRKSSVGFVIIHQSFSVLTADQIGSFTDVSIGEEFAKRGYRALVADTEETAGSYHVHDLLPDIGEAVGYFRDHDDVDTVIVVGYSRGASLMSFYQNVAENGIEAAQGDDLLFPAPDDIETPPAADGVLILDGVLGTGPGGGSQAEGLLEVDPRVEDNDPRSLGGPDPFSAANGFAPDGNADYDQAFLDEVFEAQAARMNDLIDEAATATAAIDEGDGRFPDDDQFLAAGLNTPVADFDDDLLAHTAEEWPLLSTDGSVSVQQVPYVGPVPDPAPEITYDDQSLSTTVEKFLSTSAIRPTEDYRITEDSIEGLDYTSTNAEAPGNLRGVSSPLLIMGFTGDRNYNVHCEIMMQNAGSSDKSLLFVEGAGHGFQPLDEEQYGDTAKLIFDTIDEWAAERFV
jgi:hypothetical protein